MRPGLYLTAFPSSQSTAANNASLVSSVVTATLFLNGEGARARNLRTPQWLQRACLLEQGMGSACQQQCPPKSPHEQSHSVEDTQAPLDTAQALPA